MDFVLVYDVNITNGDIHLLLKYERKGVPLGKPLFLDLVHHSFMECFVSVYLFLPVATFGLRTKDGGRWKLQKEMENKKSLKNKKTLDIYTEQTVLKPP